MKKILAVLLIGVMAAAMLTACGSQSAKPTEDGGTGESAEQAVTNFLEAVKNKDSETASKYLEKGDKLEFGEVEEWTELYDKVLDFDYKILDSREESKSAKVNVELITYDWSTFFGAVVSDSVNAALEYAFNAISNSGDMDENSMKQLLTDVINKNLALLDEKDEDHELEIILKKTSEGWKITKGDSLSNGIFGGALEKMKEAFGSLMP